MQHSIKATQFVKGNLPNILLDLINPKVRLGAKGRCLIVIRIKANHFMAGGE